MAVAGRGVKREGGGGNKGWMGCSFNLGVD